MADVIENTSNTAENKSTNNLSSTYQRTSNTGEFGCVYFDGEREILERTAKKQINNSISYIFAVFFVSYDEKISFC